MPSSFKLVRDKIPDIIREEGRTPRTRVVRAKAYKQALLQKLQEEVDELSAAPSKEEAADVLEVLHALCLAYGIPLSEVEKVRKAKVRKRGGFSRGIVLEQV
ncbi:MAG TPA: nucleoside triphosphate pyrophosphohydrolase [Candidatus Woesebacteria bacterium]|nr:nucleoside triphosphate pyrophosphohydrolase [Candidatus Woesebacteria bacterium]HNS95214.1 nucleoside triphosphate pyrophosphohydrolase [Candidatus Woesebacteria bacterium]